MPSDKLNKYRKYLHSAQQRAVRELWNITATPLFYNMKAIWMTGNISERGRAVMKFHVRDNV